MRLKGSSGFWLTRRTGKEEAVAEHSLQHKEGSWAGVRGDVRLESSAKCTCGQW